MVACDQESTLATTSRLDSHPLPACIANLVLPEVPSAPVPAPFSAAARCSPPHLCPHILGDGVGLLSDRGQDTASQLALLLATNPQALEISTPPTPSLTLGQPPPSYFSIPRQEARGGALWGRTEEEGSCGVA